MRFVVDPTIQAIGRLEFEVGLRMGVLKEGSGTLGVPALSLFTATKGVIVRKLDREA